MSATILSFILIFGIQSTLCLSSVCFEPGVCANSFLLKEMHADTKNECLLLCRDTPECEWFSFYLELSVCALFTNCENLSAEECPKCVSGQKNCQQQYTCEVQGQCQGTFLHAENQTSYTSCLSACYTKPECQWFTWDSNDETCFFFQDCMFSVEDSCKSCLSGQKGCNVKGKSCKEIKNTYPWSEDGIYIIKPDEQSNTIEVYCEMTTDGGGWTVMAYLRSQDQWDYQLFEDNGEVGDVIDGFSTGATLKSINAMFNEKLIVYLALEEMGEMLGKQWMINQRPDALSFSQIGTDVGWSYKDSFGYSKDDAIHVCSHGCDKYRTYGMFGYNRGSPDAGFCGTQGGDYGCRDGNNICWVPRSLGLGCNVGDARCALLSGDGEGVIYAVR